MINDLQEIEALIKNTLLESQNIIQIKIPESNDYAIAIEVDREHSIDAWNLMRSLVKKTQRWPVLTAPEQGDCLHPLDKKHQDWEKAALKSDFFSRFFYEDEPRFRKHQDTSPNAIISSSHSFETETFINGRIDTFWGNTEWEDWEDWDEEEYDEAIDDTIRKIKHRFGSSPQQAQLKEKIKKILKSDPGKIKVEIERWLFSWELKNIDYEVAIKFPHTNYSQHYEPDIYKLALILLPIENSWESLAYMHWYGSCSVGSDGTVAFLKRWHERHEAELVYHYGTMIELKVGKPPKSPKEAFALAIEHNAVSPYTIFAPGISLRDYARQLMSAKHWFFHERP